MNRTPHERIRGLYCVKLGMILEKDSNHNGDIIQFNGIALS
jgi:hypothetical protein